MAKRKHPRRRKNVRSSLGKDLVQFAIPGMTVFIIEINVLRADGLESIWRPIGRTIVHPSSIVAMPAHEVGGMLLFLLGLTVMCWGQLTLYLNYSGTVVIREGHELVTRGIYRFVRNPMYLGLFIAVIAGLPLYVPSLRGFLVALLLVPIVLNRVRLEEELLSAHFGEAYVDYKRRTKRILPGLF